MTSYVKHTNQFDYLIRGPLHSLDIELTERCNNNCIHCCINLPANDLKAKKHEMTFEEIKVVLQEAANLGCLKVRLTGGEPLLRPDFEQIYLYARRLGLKVQIFSNARLITSRLARLFSQIPPLEYIEITVYGMHKDSYETNSQQPGSYQSFMRGLNYLEEFKVPFIIKSVLLPANQHEMDELKNWARTIPWMDHKDPGITMFYDLRNRRDDIQKNKIIKSLRPNPEAAVKFLIDYHGNIDATKDHYWKSMSRLPGDRLFLCSAGEHQLTIDSYGQVQPCMVLRSPDIVQPKGTTLENALVKFKKLKQVKATNSEYLRRCARCFLRNLCEQCPGKAWSETGTLDTPVQYLCDVSHALARHMGWLRKNEVSWEVNDWMERIQP